MGVFGGSVAYYHFPRVAPTRDTPMPLPDFGYDLIPYWCPMLNDDTNMQSVILLFLYVWVLIGAFFKQNNQGRLLLQQLFHLNAIIFLIRTTSVGVTGLPQPNPRCEPIQYEGVTYVEAIKFVMLRGFPPHALHDVGAHACGDLIFSGHVACTLLCIVILHKHDYLNSVMAYAVTILLALLSMVFVISCRSHYTVDVVLATHIVYFVQYWYYFKSDSITRFYYANSKNISLSTQLIAWLEDKDINTKKEGDTSDSCSESSISSNISNLPKY